MEAAARGAPPEAGGAEILTFLFADIEGSTALLRRMGEGVYAQVLADHQAIIRSGLAAYDGREVDTQGDGFFAVFSSLGACVAAVLEMQRALQAHVWPAGERVRVRIGVHVGEASRAAAGLVGLEVHRAARVAAVGYGGQVLVSEAAAVLVRDALPHGAALADLGRQIIGQRRVAQRPQRREPCLQARRLQLEDPFWAAQVLQPVHSQIRQRHARRQPIPHQGSRRLRQQHLAPIPGRGHPGGPVHLHPHRAPGRLFRLPSVDAHPHPDVLPARPRVGLQVLLHLNHCGHARPE